MKKYFILAALTLISACSNPKMITHSMYEPTSSYPEVLEVHITVDKYRIQDFEVLTENVPDIEFGQRFSDGHKIIVSFYPVRKNGQYWLANIPGIESGTVTIEATRYSHKHQFPSGRIPPDKVVIYMEIDNKEVSRHYVANASEDTLGLYYEKPLVAQGHRFGVIRSHMFPSAWWAFRFPTSNGNFNLIAPLQ